MMMALFGQNPVLIAGFDILFIGKKGFSSLARARTFKVRTKGSKDPWITLDVSKLRSKKAKEQALYKQLQKLSFHRDVEKKPKKPKAPKKKAKKELKTDDIKFRLTKSIDKVITNKKDEKLSIRKLIYEMPEAINFVKGRDFSPMNMQRYLNAVKKEFKAIRKKYGQTQYFIRLHHQYKNLPSNMTIDPEEKGFGGYALHRQEFRSDEAVNTQFDLVLGRDYPESFSKYLRFASTSTNFDFIGFMVEVTIKNLGASRTYKRSKRPVRVEENPKNRKKRGKKGTKLARSA